MIGPEYDARNDAVYQATGSSLQSTAIIRNIDFSSSTIQHYAFLTGQDNSGAIGIAYVGTTCLQASYGKKKIFFTQMDFIYLCYIKFGSAINFTTDFFE